MNIYTLHESANSGEIKKMFADEIFTLQKSTLLQCTRLPTIFADPAKRNAFYAKSLSIIPNHFCSLKILRFSEVYPKFHRSFS